MDKISLSQEFKNFLKLLNQNQVEYLLIGGYAVGYFGYPRFTGDIDFFIKISESNAEKMVKTITEFGFGTPELNKDFFLEKGIITRMGNIPLRIEILNKISALEFDECFEKRVTFVYEGITINMISLEHLKINKKASGRHKDLDDLENLP